METGPVISLYISAGVRKSMQGRKSEGRQGTADRQGAETQAII